MAEYLQPKGIPADHKDLIEDVSYDFYGRRIATCSLDQNVKVCCWLPSYFIKSMPPIIWLGMVQSIYCIIIVCVQIRLGSYFNVHCPYLAFAGVGYG